MCKDMQWHSASMYGMQWKSKGIAMIWQALNSKGNAEKGMDLIGKGKARNGNAMENRGSEESSCR